MNPKPTEGWTWLYNATKWHYFRDGYSLCGKWMILGEQDYEQGNNDSPDNCKSCKRKLLKEQKDKRG